MKPTSSTVAQGSSQPAAAIFAMITATLMIAHQVAGKATRDGLFLTYFDVTELPKAVMASAILSFFFVLLMSRLLTRFGPALVVPCGYGISALLFGIEWYYYDIWPRYVVVGLYLHMATFGAILISGFWSVINERFDPYSGKRTIARVAAAATLGGLVGGVVTERVVTLYGSHAMLLVLGAMQIACCIALLLLGMGQSKKFVQPANGKKHGIMTIFKVPYLRQMAIVMTLVAVVAALLDYAVKAQASYAFTTKASLTSFFAAFYSIVGLLTFVIQSAFGPKMLQRFGLAGTMSVLPGAVLVGGVFGTAVLHLWTVTVLRAAEAMIASSFFRSAFELLYTPLSPEKKRPTKIIIDVGSNRFGDLLGGGLLALLLYFIPNLPISLVISIAMVASGISFFVITRLQAGYVNQLAESLRSGTLSIDDNQIQDATTRSALRKNIGVSDRSILESKLNALGKTDATTEAEHQAMTGQLEALLQTTPEQALLIQAITDLSSGDHARIERALNGDIMDDGMLPYMVPLLADDAWVDDVRMLLRFRVQQSLGLLTDILTNPDTPVLVRERIPEVMEVSHHPRSIEGLTAGLSDGDFTVRYSCARTLARMLSRGSSLSVSRERAFEVIEDELTVGDDAWNAHCRSQIEGGEDENDHSSGAAASLHHVFTVLSLALDREAVEIARQALVDKDSNLIGTALEYLENVLPDELRTLLWQRLNLENDTSRKNGKSQ